MPRYFPPYSEGNSTLPQLSHRPAQIRVPPSATPNSTPRTSSLEQPSPGPYPLCPLTPVPFFKKILDSIMPQGPCNCCSSTQKCPSPALLSIPPTGPAQQPAHPDCPPFLYQALSVAMTLQIHACVYQPPPCPHRHPECNPWMTEIDLVHGSFPDTLWDLRVLYSTNEE